jgi:hypothetical protein
MLVSKSSRLEGAYSSRKSTSLADRICQTMYNLLKALLTTAAMRRKNSPEPVRQSYAATIEKSKKDS